MKQLLCALMLTAGINGTLIAQQTDNAVRPSRTFDLAPTYINRRFYIDLQQGNEIQLGLRSIKDMAYIGDLDSLIRVCLRDLAPLKDSLTDELTSKRIDYTIQASGRKEIRFRQYAPNGSSFLLQQGELSALKIAQDTIHILATVSRPVPLSENKSGHESDRYEVTIIVNELSALPRLMEHSLKGKVDTLKQAVRDFFTNSDWQWVEGRNRRLYLKQAPSISEAYNMGTIGPARDGISVFAAANVQNYKNYFAPSINLGFNVLFNSSWDLFGKPSLYQYTLGLSWEPQFFFQNIQGGLHTYRNDFLTLTYDQTRKGNRPAKKGLDINFPTRFSLAYLINRNGPYFEKNTFRLGVDNIGFHNDKFNLEPLIYFHDLFKNVTPGIRLQLRF
ncbi:MAG TPA: hypothetical protein VL832_17465 [Puia sp.]|nr:hypothetical protein [Puia sp.]